MQKELIFKTSFDNAYIFNNGRENEIKLRMSVFPSEEIRRQFERASIENLGVDLCLVIDNSHSMYELVDNTGAQRSGEITIVEGKEMYAVTGGISKLDVAIEAAKKIVSSARAIDTISLVTFNQEVDVLFENESIVNKDYMIRRIDSIRAKGLTDIAYALRETGKVFDKTRNNGKVKKVIFLTDGEPKIYGEPNEITVENCLMEARNLANKNITVDCLGIGKAINYSFLEKLSIPSNGRTEIVNKIADATKVFEKLFQNSKDVVITDAVLKLTNISKSMRVTEHYKGTPENRYLGKVKLGTARELTFNLGQIEINQQYDYFFNLILMDQEGYEGNLRLMTATIEYSIPALYGSNRISNSCNVLIEVGNNSSKKLKDGQVTAAFKLAEVKRYEDEAEQASENREHAYVIDRYKKIVNIYESLMRLDLANMYRDLLRDYEISKKLNLGKLNKARNSSSKAVENGTQTRMTDEEFEGTTGGIRKVDHSVRRRG